MPAPIWTTIHAERRALLADLETLTPQQWATPSLCAGWTVHRLVGHLLAITTTTPLSFFAGFTAAGFRFDRMVAADATRLTAGGPLHTLDAFRTHLSDTTAPPSPPRAWLGELVVHGADLRRPLGLSHRPPTQALTSVADFYARSNLLIGGKRRIAGLRLVATDADWSIGTGPEVSGEMLPLVLAITGRSDGLRDLRGPGVDVLRARMPGPRAADQEPAA